MDSKMEDLKKKKKKRSRSHKKKNKEEEPEKVEKEAVEAPEEKVKDAKKKLKSSDDEGSKKEKKEKKAKKEKTEKSESKDEAPKEGDESVLGSPKFEDLAIWDLVKNNIKSEFGFENMTEIQQKTIPPLLAGKNVLGEGKTGSGKTMAFLLPCIELLHRAQFKQRNGTGVLIITPTRELAMQIYGVARDLLSGSNAHTFGVVIGGANKKAEAEKLANGVNLLVATPGRLLDHLQGTSQFTVKNLLAFVIDEADRILQQGFEEEMRTILRLLPKKRQTMLFSATQTQNVTQLAKLSFTERPLFISVKKSEKNDLATVQGLQQGYIVCPSEMRFLLLFTFLKKNLNKKMMVFMSSCASVKFIDELLNYIDIPVLSIHGKQKQAKRTSTFFEFCNSKSGILICTDVAARGLDIPAVDWIIQYDPPDECAEYIHRVGRTARAGGSGKALLFLLETELGFLKYLRAAGVPLNEYSVPKEKIANIQDQLEKLMTKNYYLYQSSRDAYRGYVLSYQSHSLKDCYDVYKLDLQRVAKSFGFAAPPKINLNIKPNPKTSKSSDVMMRRKGGGNQDNAVRRFKTDPRQWAK